MSGWYSVKPSIVKKNGGSFFVLNPISPQTLKYTIKITGKTLLDNYYNGSLRLALQDCYPEHKWIDEHFSRSARNKWQSAENQLAFVKQLESKLNIKDLHDWYFITLEEVERAISSSTEGKSSSKLLWKHNNQLYSLLKTVYPQHQWYGWKFAVVPRNYWKSVPLEEAKAFIRDAEEKLGIQNPSDWYSVSHSQLRSAGIRVPRAERSATWNTGMFLQILSQVYPEHKWEKDRFRMSRKLSEQPLLSRNISQLLPETKNNLPSQL